MRLWAWFTKHPMDEQVKLHDAMLEESKRLFEEASAQRASLVKKANGHLEEFQAELGGSKPNAGKSGTEL